MYLFQKWLVSVLRNSCVLKTQTLCAVRGASVFLTFRWKLLLPLRIMLCVYLYPVETLSSYEISIYLSIWFLLINNNEKKKSIFSSFFTFCFLVMLIPHKTLADIYLFLKWRWDNHLIKPSYLKPSMLAILPGRQAF